MIETTKNHIPNNQSTESIVKCDSIHCNQQRVTVAPFEMTFEILCSVACIPVGTPIPIEPSSWQNPRT